MKPTESEIELNLSQRYRRALGFDAHSLEDTGRWGLLEANTARAFQRLRRRAAASGFDLHIASGFRGYQRQWQIFNGKALGQRSVADEQGQALQRQQFSDEQWLHAILRFSALPGTSRHHWGTDVDVYDGASVTADYQLGLAPAEYAPEGPFGPLTAWLSERIAADDAEGFFRPYQTDLGGVAPEPWHLSYRPSTTGLRAALEPDLLETLWRGQLPGALALLSTSADDETLPGPLPLLDMVVAQLPALLNRYVVA